jgi:trimethylamine--corrinoid protein Co-methyltransferase
MKAATSPMIAVEALQLDLAYVAVAKSLGLPTQGYLALSEGKFMDAQAGAETYGSAMLAALAGINSVSGPGMLDYVMVFSLAKLVLDDEWCGHALRLVRDIQLKEDIPTIPLVRDLLAEQHLITAEHTLNHWPEELYLPGPALDRDNRENWVKAGRPTLEERVNAEVERRLAAYQQPEIDSQLVLEMEKIIRSGLTSDNILPEIPPVPKIEKARTARTRRRTRRGG